MERPNGWKRSSNRKNSTDNLKTCFRRLRRWMWVRARFQHIPTMTYPLHNCSVCNEIENEISSVKNNIRLMHVLASFEAANDCLRMDNIWWIINKFEHFFAMSLNVIERDENRLYCRDCCFLPSAFVFISYARLIINNWNAFVFCIENSKYTNMRGNLFMFDEFIFIQLNWTFDGWLQPRVFTKLIHSLQLFLISFVYISYSKMCIGSGINNIQRS